MFFRNILSFGSSLTLLFLLCGLTLRTTCSFGIIPTTTTASQSPQKSTLRSDASLAADDSSAAARTSTTTLLSPENLLSYLLDSFQGNQQHQRQQEEEHPFKKLDLLSLWWQPSKNKQLLTSTTSAFLANLSNDDAKDGSSSPSTFKKDEFTNRFWGFSFSPLTDKQQSSIHIQDTSSGNKVRSQDDNPVIRLWSVLATPSRSSSSSSSSSTSETSSAAPVENGDSSTSISNSKSSSSSKSSSINNDGPIPLVTQADWGAYLDESTGLVYYFNTRNGTSQWNPPTPDFPRVQIPSQPKPLATVGQWSSYWDQMGTGWLYYFNHQTGQSTWERPFDLFPRVVQKKTAAAASSSAAASVASSSLSAASVESSSSSAAAAAAAAASSTASSGAPLPLASQGDWAAYADSKGCIYYWNRVTQTSQWQPPRNFPAIGGNSNKAVVANATNSKKNQSREPWFGQLLQALVNLVQQASQQQQLTVEQQQEEPAKQKGIFGLFGHQEAVSSKKGSNFNWFLGELFSKHNKAKTSKPKTSNIVGRGTALIGYAQQKQSSRRPMPSFSDLIYQDRKIDIVRHAPTFSIPNPKGRRQEALRRRQQQQQLSLLKNIPRLAQWRPNPDGSVTGRVGNSDKFADGTLITTAPLSQQNVLSQQQSIVKTVTGTQYYLL